MVFLILKYFLQNILVICFNDGFLIFMNPNIINVNIHEITKSNYSRDIDHLISFNKMVFG